MHLMTFQEQCPRFKAWLMAQGSDILEPTNEYEVARFTTKKGIGVVYMNRHGRITEFVSGADDAWQAWNERKEYSIKPKTPRKGRGGKRRMMIVQAIAERDGWNCVYCGKEMDADSATLEHIVPIARGGFDGTPNMTLACAQCNKVVGHMSGRQKIEYAIMRRCI